MLAKRLSSWIYTFSWHYLLLIVIILVAFAFRANNLDAKSLWVDEIGQVRASRDGYLAAIRGASKHFGATPLDYEITHIVAHTLGQGEAALRLPSVIWGTVAIFLVYWLGVSVFSSRLVGLVSAVLLAFSPAHIQYSQEVRWYSLSTTLALLTANLVILAVHKRRPFYWIFVSIALLLSVTTAVHHVLTTMAIFIALFLIWQLTSHSANRDPDAPNGIDLIKFGVASIPAAAFVLYWYLSGSLRSEVGSFFKFTPVPWNNLIVWPTFGTYGMPPQPWFFPLSIIGLILFPLSAALGLLVSALRRKALAMIPFTIILLCGAGIYALDAKFGYFWAYRQFTFLAPFYLLLVAYGLVSVVELIKWPQWLSKAVLVACVGSLLWFMLPKITEYYNTAKANWRGTADLLHQVSGDPRSKIFFPDDYNGYLLFYRPDLERRLLPLSALDEYAPQGGTDERIWYAGPRDKVAELQQAGWNAIKVDTGLVGPGIIFYYLGQKDEGDLYRELTQLTLPPEVLVNGFLYGLRKVDQQLALDVGNAAIKGSLHSYFPMTSRTKADIGARVGRIYFEAGQSDKAMAMEKWALDNDPTNLEGLTELAFILISSHNPSAARAPLEKSVQLYPSFYWSYTALANIYTQTGEWDKAAEAYFHAYENASSSRSDLKKAHLTAAIEAYQKAEQPEKAQQMQALLDQE